MAIPGHAQASLREGVYDWKTWDISERPDHGLNSQSLNKTVVRHFKTLILENEYLTVTLLPEYGGRILSILNKSTGHEELFQNPVGFADGIGAGSFYYDWLMVLGGIFPTFPEPEHGKTYLLPWKSEVVANGPDRVSVAMSLKDDIDFSGHPEKFNIGVTGLTCIATVTLAAGKASVEMGMQLRNDKAQSVRYEYWTCHALAPGSVPGDTKSPQSTEMVVPIAKYSVGFGTDGIDRDIDGGKEYKNLAFFKNWKDLGIAYAEPAVTRKWWGVLNHDNEEGLFRIVDDPKQTPGLKFWTWGYKDNYPLASRERQFIELWAGAGHQFFSPVQIAANSTRQWTETYIPTAGLKKVTLANEDALVSLETDKPTYDGMHDQSMAITADIVSATPGLPLALRITGGMNGGSILLDTLLIPNPKDASHIRITRPLSSIGPGKQTVGLRLTDTQGRIRLEASTDIVVANVTLAIRSRNGQDPQGREADAPRKDFTVESGPRGNIVLHFPDARARELEVLDLPGRIRFQAILKETTAYPLPGIPGQGLFWIRIREDRKPSWQPLWIRIK